MTIRLVHDVDGRTPTYIQYKAYVIEFLVFGRTARVVEFFALYQVLRRP